MSLTSREYRMIALLIIDTCFFLLEAIVGEYTDEERSIGDHKVQAHVLTQVMPSTHWPLWPTRSTC